MSQLHFHQAFGVIRTQTEHWWDTFDRDRQGVLDLGHACEQLIARLLSSMAAQAMLHITIVNRLFPDSHDAPGQDADVRSMNEAVDEIRSLLLHLSKHSNRMYHQLVRYVGIRDPNVIGREEFIAYFGLLLQAKMQASLRRILPP
jgi:hypothetical protein